MSRGSSYAQAFMVGGWCCFWRKCIRLFIPEGWGAASLFGITLPGTELHLSHRVYLSPLPHIQRRGRCEGQCKRRVEVATTPCLLAFPNSLEHVLLSSCLVPIFGYRLPHTTTERLMTASIYSCMILLIPRVIQDFDPSLPKAVCN